MASPGPPEQSIRRVETSRSPEKPQALVIYAIDIRTRSHRPLNDPIYVMENSIPLLFSGQPSRGDAKHLDCVLLDGR
jgi:hypothetical protein